MGDLKLGLAQGYWGASPNPNFVEMAQEAEQLGYDSVWSAEAGGNDACTPLAWSGAPEGTKSFALICDDPDAPTDEPWVHWVIFNLPPEMTALPGGIGKEGAPEGTTQGVNSWPSDNQGYRGPAPPEGDGRGRRDGGRHQEDVPGGDHPTCEVAVGRAGRGFAWQRDARSVSDAAAASRRGDGGACFREQRKQPFSLGGLGHVG